LTATTVAFSKPHVYFDIICASVTRGINTIATILMPQVSSRRACQTNGEPHAARPKPTTEASNKHTDTVNRCQCS
jgi:hypothetical protein